MLYEKLDYVLAIAEEQNLTRAAKKLYISDDVPEPIGRKPGSQAF